ncbi:MAG: hypothetical protein IT320_26805 [Anaerolineae bacterium]|nr:hypothetical protein [Anaerolineae bacterium]
MTALPQRKSPRLQGYDYAQSGVYFVTICTIRRVECFGVINDGIMTRSPVGEIAHNELVSIPDRWHNVHLDLFVVMPNHVHAIVVIESEDAQIPDGKNAVPTNDNDVGTPLLASAPSVKSATPMLGNIVGAYKAGVTRLVREQGLLDDGEPLSGKRAFTITSSAANARSTASANTSSTIRCAGRKMLSIPPNQKRRPCGRRSCLSAGIFSHPRCPSL